MFRRPPFTRVMFFSFSFLYGHPVSPAISVLSFLPCSAQQRSSQTNKSQSSAGNQVSVCHVLSVIHKRRSTRSREDCTPTQQQDGCCRDNKKREMMKLKRFNPRYSLISVNPLHRTHFMLYTFYPYVFIIIILYCSHACCILFSGAPVVYSLLLWFYDFMSKRISLGSTTLCHHHHWCCCC